jgi:hypothetical protein
VAKKNDKLDKEEQALLDAYETGKLKSVPNAESEKKRIRAIFSSQTKGKIVDKATRS